MMYLTAAECRPLPDEGENIAATARFVKTQNPRPGIAPAIQAITTTRIRLSEVIAPFLRLTECIPTGGRPAKERDLIDFLNDAAKNYRWGVFGQLMHIASV